MSQRREQLQDYFFANSSNFPVPLSKKNYEELDERKAIFSLMSQGYNLLTGGFR